jgi:hypothetical protein
LSTAPTASTSEPLNLQWRSSNDLSPLSSHSYALLAPFGVFRGPARIDFWSSRRIGSIVRLCSSIPFIYLFLQFLQLSCMVVFLFGSRAQLLQHDDFYAPDAVHQVVQLGVHITLQLFQDVKVLRCTLNPSKQILEVLAQ